MSGGGGGSWSGGGGPGGPDISIDTDDPCEDLDLTTSLQSPNAQVIAQLNPGQFLDVVLHGSSVAAVDTSGAVAGYILSHLAQLLRCLQGGYAFRAEVLSIAGGAVRVRVRPI